MYIPSTFMSTQGSCFTVTTNSITGSGLITSGSFISGGVVWEYYQFDNTADVSVSTASFVANFNILSGSTGQAKILVVGGGGAGGFNAGSQCINPYIDTLGSAGGGGGGGVVYYNQFPLSSGSYEVSVGTGGRPIGRVGFNGGVSYFKNKDFSYTPFTSSLITAYGGGGGAGCVSNCSPGTGFGIGAQGASSGGGAQTGIANGNVPAVDPLNVFGGVPPIKQGNGSGAITTSPYGADRAMGGGGALTSSANITPTYNPTAGSPGGDGISYNLTGTSLAYGAGGGGVRWANTGAGTLTGNGAGWGNPGSGGTGGFGGRYTVPRAATAGTNGTVIIAIPKCYEQATQCRTYIVRAGASNSATVTYYPCGVNTLASASLGPGSSGSICSYPIGGFPTISGVGSQITASVTCSTDIELPPTCPSGTQLTNLHYYQYSNTTTGSGGERAYGSATYYNAAGQLVVAENFAYENPTEYFCAKEVPQPFISSGSGILLDLGVGGCGDYCTSSYAPPPPFPPFPYDCSCYIFSAGGDGPGPEPGIVGGLDCITGQYVGFSGNSTNVVGGRYCWRTGTPSGAGTYSITGPIGTCTGGAC